MGLITLKCPQCNGDLNVEDNQDSFFCPYCGTKVVHKAEVENNYFINMVANTNDEYFGRWVKTIVRGGNVKKATEVFEEKCYDDDRNDIVAGVNDLFFSKPNLDRPMYADLEKVTEDLLVSLNERRQEYEKNYNTQLEKITGAEINLETKTELLNYVADSKIQVLTHFDDNIQKVKESLERRAPIIEMQRRKEAAADKIAVTFAAVASTIIIAIIGGCIIAFYFV